MNKTVITFYVKTKGNVIQQVGRSSIEQPVTKSEFLKMNGNKK